MTYTELKSKLSRLDENQLMHILYECYADGHDDPMDFDDYEDIEMDMCMENYRDIKTHLLSELKVRADECGQGELINELANNVKPALKLA